MNNDVIVITGGRGAIGTALAKRLAARHPSRLFVIDDLSSGAQNPAVMDAEFVHCDVANAEKLPRVIKAISPTRIFHLAAHFANQNSVDHPRSDAMANIVGLINVYESVRELSRPAKIVYSSSSCVYGHGPLMSEDADVHPYETPYAISKYAGELYVRYYAQTQKIPGLSIRLFNTYGPGEAPGRYRNVIPNFINRALAGLPILVTGDGTETRDFTYVDDTVDLLIRASMSQYQQGEIFNGGTGIQTSILDLAQLVIRLTGSGAKPEFQPRRAWDMVTSRQAQNDKAKLLLGYDPQTPLQQGLQTTIEWVRAWRAGLRTDAY
jgi:UDP-glucose 4-epimerase